MGRPPAIEDGEILTLLENRDKVALTTGDIADALDVHRNTAHSRLKKLKNQGKVGCDKLGTADVWFLSHDDPIVTPAGGSWIREELACLVKSIRSAIGGN